MGPFVGVEVPEGCAGTHDGDTVLDGIVGPRRTSIQGLSICHCVVDPTACSEGQGVTRPQAAVRADSRPATMASRAGRFSPSVTNPTTGPPSNSSEGRCPATWRGGTTSDQPR